MTGAHHRHRSGKPIRDPLQVNLRWLVVLILLAVILPTAVLTGIGIAVIVAREEALDLVFGVLVISFASSVIAGAVLLMILARRGARLARVQETFLSHMGHELLTPLAGIRLHGQILDGMQLPPEASSSIGAIRKEAARLQTLVERILRWRMIRSKRHLYEKLQTSAESIVTRVLELLPEPDAIRVIVRDPHLSLTADEEALSEAIVNLVQNSLKYAGSDGDVELLVRRFADRALFVVRDRGPGLPADRSERLFEPFFRLVPAAEPDPGGSGLGLTIARQIAVAHGGHLRASNRGGGGARFSIILPIAQAKQ